MIVFSTLQRLLARLVDGMPPQAVTFLLLALSALFAYLALFAPVGRRRAFLIGAL